MSSSLEDHIFLTTTKYTSACTTTVQGVGGGAKDKDHVLVFFITGNPGLVEYYRTFLTLIFDSLRSVHSGLEITVAGTSLAGFQVSSSSFSLPSLDGSGIGRQGESKGPVGLEDQISYVEQALRKRVREIREEGKRTRVVLIGHSVGSYILLEVLRRWKERRSDSVDSNSNVHRNNDSGNDGHGGSSRGSVHGSEDVEIMAGICLFPTVTHIAKSASGRKFSLLFKIPHLPFLANLLTNTLFSHLPTPLLSNLVSLITGMPPPAAAVTTAFLQSRGGVRQALFLAGDEMRMIREDTWGDELWVVVDGDEMVGDGGRREGKERRKGKETKLFLLFGTNDHWVADETRDELIAARAAVSKVDSRQQRQGEADMDLRPKMEIDGSGIPHGFCIKHNDHVAKKTVEYIEEAIRANW